MAPDLTTWRLHMRRWRDEDMDAFAALNADPRVMEFFPTTLTRLESNALATRIDAGLAENAFGLWAVEVREEASFAGFVGLTEPRFTAHFTPCVEIGWRLAHPHWGKGYAFEAAQQVIAYAFQDLHLPQLVSFTAVFNIRSQLLMKRLGFTSEHSDNFNHPSLPEGHPMQRHVLYRLKAG
jgi:RimJ/RimL family protein N-acetyltransferase